MTETRPGCPSGRRVRTRPVIPSTSGTALLMRQPPSLSFTRSYRPGAPGRACQSMTSSPVPVCRSVARLFPVAVDKIESCTMSRTIEFARRICNSSASVACAAGSVCAGCRGAAAPEHPEATICIVYRSSTADGGAMTSTVRRSKMQRVSRFDAAIRPQIESSEQPRIDVEPVQTGDPGSVHASTPRVSASGPTIVESCIERDGSDACAADSVSAAERPVVVTSYRHHAGEVTTATVANRLLETIAWSLLLWIPVCLWLAIEVRL